MTCKYMKRFKGILIGILLGFITIADVFAMEGTKSSGGFGTSADYDERQGIVQVHLIYMDGNNQPHILKQGCGFFIGDMESGEYVLTNHSTVMLTEEEKNAYIAQFALESEKLDTKIQVVLQKDVAIEFTEANSSQSMDLAILTPSNSLGSVTNLRLSEAEYYEQGTFVHTLGFMDIAGGNTEVVSGEGILEDWTSRNDIHYLKHTVTITGNNKGGPLLNDAGEVIGINVVSNDGGYYSLQISEVIELLNTLGITYNAEISVDISVLEETLAVYEEYNFELYTEETVETCKVIYEQANEVLAQVEQGDITPYTQEYIDTVNEELNEAMEGLEKKGMSTRQIIIMFSAIISVLVIVLVVIIVMLHLKKKRLKEELEKERHLTPRERLGIQERVKPEETGEQLKAYLPINRTLSELHSESNVVQNFNETTVLNAGTSEEFAQKMNVLRAYPVLIRLKTGDVIQITKNSFVIGKSSEQVDYFISGNTNISRTHVCIKQMRDGYYIQDLKTTNGTYVDGIKVSCERDIKLMDGCIIKMADEEFEFKCDR